MATRNLVDLKDHLFDQIESLKSKDAGTKDFTGEIRRAYAVVAVAEQIVSISAVHTKAADLTAQHGGDFRRPLPDYITHEGAADDEG